MQIHFIKKWKFTNLKFFYRIFPRQKRTYYILQNPEEKKNRRICICIDTARNNQQLPPPPPPPRRRPLPLRLLLIKHARKKKKPGELITHHHHPFVDPPSSIIIKCCSSSCFPTWEVQILGQHHCPSLLLWRRSCLERWYEKISNFVLISNQRFKVQLQRSSSLVPG